MTKHNYLLLLLLLAICRAIPPSAVSSGYFCNGNLMIWLSKLFFYDCQVSFKIKFDFRCGSPSERLGQLTIVGAMAINTVLLTSLDVVAIVP